MTFSFENMIFCQVRTNKKQIILAIVKNAKYISSKTFDPVVKLPIIWNYSRRIIVFLHVNCIFIRLILLTLDPTHPRQRILWPNLTRLDSTRPDPQANHVQLWSKQTRRSVPTVLQYSDRTSHVWERAPIISGTRMVTIDYRCLPRCTRIT